MPIKRVGGPKAVDEGLGGFKWKVALSERLNGTTERLVREAGAALHHSGAGIHELEFADGDDAAYFWARRDGVPRWLEAIDAWLGHVSTRMEEDQQRRDHEDQRQRDTSAERLRRLGAASDEFKDR